MDGQRRIAQSVRRFARSRTFAQVQARAQSRGVGIAVRAGGIAFIAMAILLGLSTGGHLGAPDPTYRGIHDKLAAKTGFAAQNIVISGLTDHQPEQLLKVLGLAPGGSLIGFDPDLAKGLLEGIDWVETASIQRKFPNQLEIIVKERQPFAVWQRGKSHYVIDRHGIAMSGINPARVAQLPLVSGEGANLAAAELFAALDKQPDLHIKVNGAARVGDRRWTLYLDGGVKVLLPEAGIDEALALVQDMDRSHGILARAITEIDVRNPAQFRVAAAPATVDVPTGSIE